MQHALAVQLNILTADHLSLIGARWDVPPTIDTSEFGENMVVGRAYIRVRVPDGKLAAPLLDVLVDLVTGACGLGCCHRVA